MPPLPEVIDGVERFLSHYFQLGFLPRKTFPELLRRDHRAVDFFLLVSILGISARLSPVLSQRYGGGLEASKFFTRKASKLAHDGIYGPVSLERCQALYLLSIAQQGSGDIKNSRVRSSIL